MYTGCHCPVTAGQKGGGVWEMDIRDPPVGARQFSPTPTIFFGWSVTVRHGPSRLITHPSEYPSRVSRRVRSPPPPQAHTCSHGVRSTGLG